ncbi:hypothetical protein [Acinetobacter johnsonii]|uniref:hypothetical protein n=1 Tax=Acinetobacter johnsonii TaxID=40214 RepID=UPI0007B3FB97|nr:hypothetical protein [Acinetobacter johnsonii]
MLILEKLYKIGVNFLRILIAIVTFIWLVCSLAYVFYAPKMTSYAIAAGGLIAFLTAIANVKQNAKKEDKTQSQHVSGKSTGIQVGNDLNINQRKNK